MQLWQTLTFLVWFYVVLLKYYFLSFSSLKLLCEENNNTGAIQYLAPGYKSMTSWWQDFLLTNFCSSKLCKICFFIILFEVVYKLSIPIKILNVECFSFSLSDLLMEVILFAVHCPEVQNSGCKQVWRSFVIRKSEEKFTNDVGKNNAFITKPLIKLRLHLICFRNFIFWDVVK